MKRKALWIATATAALALGTFSTQASAHGDPVAGAIVGGAIGAAVGGPVGAAVGAIFGTAIASTPHHPGGYYGHPHRYGPAAYAPPVSYQPAPRYYSQPAPAYYEQAPAYYSQPAPRYYGEQQGYAEQRYAEPQRYAQPQQRYYGGDQHYYGGEQQRYYGEPQRYQAPPQGGYYQQQQPQARSYREAAYQPAAPRYDSRYQRGYYVQNGQ
jgi:hypothetical protein